MKLLTRVSAFACLILSASAAYAIPLEVNVGTLALGGSQGDWYLSGPTSASGSWQHFLIESDTWNLDISPGDYSWSISGLGGGIPGGLVGWNLVLNGTTIYSGYDAGFYFFKIKDNFSFSAVPEPATLGLLGMGLCVIAFAARRRKKSATLEPVLGSTKPHVERTPWGRPD